MASKKVYKFLMAFILTYILLAIITVSCALIGPKLQSGGFVYDLVNYIGYCAGGFGGYFIYHREENGINENMLQFLLFLGWAIHSLVIIMIVKGVIKFMKS